MFAITMRQKPDNQYHLLFSELNALVGMLLERGLLQGRGGGGGGGGGGGRLALLLLIDPGMCGVDLFNGSNVMANRARLQLEAVVGSVWIWHDYFAEQSESGSTRATRAGRAIAGRHATRPTAPKRSSWGVTWQVVVCGAWAI